MRCPARSIQASSTLALGFTLLMTSQAALSAQLPAPPEGAYDAAPYLGEIRNTVVYGDIWERPGLSKRDRSLVTIAVAQALYATEQISGPTYVAASTTG